MAAARAKARMQLPGLEPKEPRAHRKGKGEQEIQFFVSAPSRASPHCAKCTEMAEEWQREQIFLLFFSPQWGDSKRFGMKTQPKMHLRQGLDCWQSWSQHHNPISALKIWDILSFQLPELSMPENCIFMCITRVLPIGSSMQRVRKFYIFCMQYFPGPHRAQQGL